MCRNFWCSSCEEEIPKKTDGFNLKIIFKTESDFRTMTSALLTVFSEPYLQDEKDLCFLDYLWFGWCHTGGKRGKGEGVVTLTQFKLDIESKIWMALLCTKLQISSTLELLLFWC